MNRSKLTLTIPIITTLRNKNKTWTKWSSISISFYCESKGSICYSSVWVTSTLTVRGSSSKSFTNCYHQSTFPLIQLHKPTYTNVSIGSWLTTTLKPSSLSWFRIWGVGWKIYPSSKPFFRFTLGSSTGAMANWVWKWGKLCKIFYMRKLPSSTKTSLSISKEC